MPFSCSGDVADAVELFPSDEFGVISPDVIEPLSTVRPTEPVGLFSRGTRL